MNPSVRTIEQAQAAWSRHLALDLRRRGYIAALGENLFLGRLNPETEAEFLAGDGSELHDSNTRPAKMRALVSSSALAVNFFDAWRYADMASLSRALGLRTTIQCLRFEHKPRGYPVRPRSPNLDRILTLADGRRVAIEAKFTEPYCATTGLSDKYFPATGGLWERVGLARAQRLAEELRPRWQHIDAAQLLKHMLGLGSETDAPTTLLYLWYDTGLPDALSHRQEVAAFDRQVHGDRVAFIACTYQEVFAALTVGAEPFSGWFSYMRSRYFDGAETV